MCHVFIAVGSNIDPEENVQAALRLLKKQARICGVSTFYRTEPEGRPEQSPFLNGVVEIETDIPPVELKERLRAIEKLLGRRRTEDKYAARTIDLDILLYNELVMADGLTIPDPDIPRRPFLAIPLCELAPELVLPGSNVPILDIAAKFAEHEMTPLVEYTERLRRDIRPSLNNNALTA